MSYGRGGAQARQDQSTGSKTLLSLVIRLPVISSCTLQQENSPKKAKPPFGGLVVLTCLVIRNGRHQKVAQHQGCPVPGRGRSHSQTLTGRKQSLGPL